MPIQANVTTEVRYGVEASLATQSVAAGQLLRRTTSTLALAKDAYTSNEVRPDQQVSDARHGVRRVGGAVSGELSTKTYDDLFEALLRGTWATGATITQAGAGAVTLTSGALTGTIAGTTFITAGFRVGDVFRFTAGPAGNLNKNFRIVALTQTSMTVFPSCTTVGSTATWSATVQGKKLVTGTTQRSFTFEHRYPEIGRSEIFLGNRIGDGQIALPPTGMATANFGVMGVNMISQSGAGFATPAAAGTQGILAAVGGSLSAAGAPSALITGLDINITNNLSSQGVVGSNVVPEIFYGRMVITGNLSAFFQDATILDYFLNETEVALQAQLDDANGTDFLRFMMPRIKLMGAQKQIGAEGGVILQSPFQALLSQGVSGVDDGTLNIQRSNLV